MCCCIVPMLIIVIHVFRLLLSIGLQVHAYLCVSMHAPICMLGLPVHMWQMAKVRVQRDGQLAGHRCVKCFGRLCRSG